MDTKKFIGFLRSVFPDDYSLEITYCEQLVTNSYHFELVFGNSCMLTKSLLFDLDDKLFYYPAEYNFYLNSFHDKVMMDIFVRPKLL